jgi:hypothetical protein
MAFSCDRVVFSSCLGVLLIFFIVHGFVVNNAVLLCGFKQTKGKRYENSDSFDRTAAGISGSVCINRLRPVEAGGGCMNQEAAITQKIQKAARRALRTLQVIEHMEAMEFERIDRLKFWYAHGDNAINNLKYALEECAQTPTPRTTPGKPINDEVMEEIIDYAHEMFLSGHYKNFDEAIIRETELEHGIGDRNE